MSVHALVARTLVPAGLGATLILLFAAGWTGARLDLVLANYATVLVVGLTVVDVAFGRRRPRLANLPRDLTLFVVNSGSDWLARVGVAWAALAFAGPGPLAGLPLPLAIPLGLVVADGVVYGIHRAFHAHPVLWRVHALHHLPDELYTLMSVVNGPAMVILIRALPVGVLTVAGFDPLVIFTYAMLDLWFGLVSHTGIDTHNPWLSRVWVTPEVHRLHHSARPEDAGNHGLLFTLWDRVFGTFVAPRPGEVRVGLVDPAGTSWVRALLLLS